MKLHKHRVPWLRMMFKDKKENLNDDTPVTADDLKARPIVSYKEHGY